MRETITGDYLSPTKLQSLSKILFLYFLIIPLRALRLCGELLRIEVFTMKVAHIALIFLLFFFACLIANADENKQYKLQNAFPKLSFDNPVDLQHADDGTNRIFVVSQKGLIYVFKEEIYAYGLRNPWRFNFDPVTGL